MRHEFRRLIISCHSSDHRTTSADLVEPSFIIELLRQLALNNATETNNQLETSTDKNEAREGGCDGEFLTYSNNIFNQLKMNNNNKSSESS